MTDEDVEVMARRLCAHLNVDPDQEVCRRVPAYLGIDVCYPAAYFVPPESSRIKMWQLFWDHAVFTIKVLNENKASHE
ncbi:MAG TPA: hypothetical protein VI358_18095 [Pseudolabrys sp.]